MKEISTPETLQRLAATLADQEQSYAFKESRKTMVWTLAYAGLYTEHQRLLGANAAIMEAATNAYQCLLADDYSLEARDRLIDQLAAAIAKGK